MKVAFDSLPLKDLQNLSYRYRHALGFLHSFYVKNISYDKMDLRFFYFCVMTIYLYFIRRFQRVYGTLFSVKYDSFGRINRHDKRLHVDPISVTSNVVRQMMPFQ